MNVESLIFRKLTPNEFKAITNTINSQGGGSQTYIDFPKGCISDDDFKEFFVDFLLILMMIRIIRLLFIFLKATIRNTGQAGSTETNAMIRGL